MNNRTNAMKKRADTLADYIIRRCENLEEENACMLNDRLAMERKLTEYNDAFYDAIKKTESINMYDDGTIELGFKEKENGERMGRLIPTTDPLYPIAKMLFKKNGIWRIKK